MDHHPGSSMRITIWVIDIDHQHGSSTPCTQWSGLEVVVSSILVISGRSGNRYTRVSGWGGNRCIMGTSMYVELDLRESCLV